MELLKIKTPRLLLRQFTIGDAEDVFAILSDEQTTLDCGGYHAFEEMDEEYERLMQKFAAQTRYSIVCRETGRVIGMMSMMDAERAVPGWEFGIEIAPDARRRGYAQEALQAVVQTYFEKTDAEIFTGGHYAYNLASGKLLKAVGFQYEGVEHKAMRHATRGATDLVCYYIENADTMQWSERSKEFTENSFNNWLKFTIWFDGMGLLVYHIFMCEYSFLGNKMARTFAILKNHEV